MTAIDLARLRELAEAARCPSEGKACACTGDCRVTLEGRTVLALLDRIAAAEAELKRLRNIPHPPVRLRRSPQVMADAYEYERKNLPQVDG